MSISTSSLDGEDELSRGVWRPVASRLSDVAPGIALDLRGHGDSDKPAPPYYWPLFVEDVAAYVQQLPAEQVVLCGHSLGGATAVEVAARVPDRVAALALVEPALSPTPSPNQSVLVAMTLRRTHLRRGGHVAGVVAAIADQLPGMGSARRR